MSFGDWAGDITFDPAEIEHERGVVKEEWRRGLGNLFDARAPVMFEGTRNGKRAPIGDAEAIDKAQRDAMVRFYKDWYRPDLMAVIVVGDIDPGAVATMIGDRFGDLANPKPERPRLSGGVPGNGTRVSIVVDKALPSTSISVTRISSHTVSWRA